jgi:hypothetical protein
MVSGAGITNMLAKTRNVVAKRQEEREREREVTIRTDGGGLESSQHAETTREQGPEQCQRPQQQPNPKPKLKLKLQSNPKAMPMPKSAPTPTPTRRWETVPPRAKSQRGPVGPCPGPGPGPAPTAGSCMAERCLTVRIDESVPLSNKMDQEIESAINRVLVYQKAPAHIRIMNSQGITKGAITAIMHPIAIAEVGLRYHAFIITPTSKVDEGVVDVEQNES